MLEEATTVDAHQISIGSLKPQFAGTAEQETHHVPFRPNKVRPEKHRMSSSGSNDEGMVLDGDRYSSSGSSKSTRSRNTSSPNKSVNQMEDEFSSELAENETAEEDQLGVQRIRRHTGSIAHVTEPRAL